MACRVPAESGLIRGKREVERVRSVHAKLDETYELRCRLAILFRMGIYWPRIVQTPGILVAHSAVPNGKSRFARHVPVVTNQPTSVADVTLVPPAPPRDPVISWSQLQ